jgi:5-methylcytosine-specific restriction endonuclease McrA
MKKPSKKTISNKLDKICGEIVRGRGRCQRCGKKENLQTAHIFGRTYHNTRWDLENLLCLCPDCHRNFAHKCPILFTEFVRKFLGEEKYEDLKEAHNQITKYTIEDLQIKLRILTTLLSTRRE